MLRSRDVALSSLFGIIIFSQKFFLPAPYDKMVTVLLQIFFLSLAFLMVGFMGPILTSFVSGILTSSMRGGLGFMTFSLALLYGVFVSSLNHLFGVAENKKIKMRRLMISSFISSVLVGFLGTIISIILEIIPYNPFLVSTIMVAGLIQGLVGGYVSGIVWEKYLRHL